MKTEARVICRCRQLLGRIALFIALGRLALLCDCRAADSVVAWGDNTYGQTTVPAGLSNAVAIAAGGSHSLALRADGTVIAWGYSENGRCTVPPNATNVVAIAGGGGHSLVLKSDGTVVAWGDNGSGQINVPASATNVVAIAAGYFFSEALRADGSVAVWGAIVPASATNVVAIGAGHWHSVGVKADGSVVVWGDNSYGQTNLPASATNVLAVAAGGNHSLALRGDGTVVAWGYNISGQTTVPASATNVVAIACGAGNSLALRADGTVIAWGDDSSGQTTVPASATNVVAIAGGAISHSLALTGDGGGPPIMVHPVSQSVMAGGAVSFKVWAVTMAGGPPLRYQWQKDDTSLSGQTNATLLLGGITGSQAGNYAVIVSNFGGQSVTSSVATLTVNCLLNVAATVGGSVTRNPDLPVYVAGAPVTLTAIPEPGYGFIRWTGDATGSTNPLTVSMGTNKNITAVFASTALTLASQGVGTVTKVPDQQFYSVGDQVTLTATPARWYAYSGWTDGVTNNPRLVTIGESNAYTAVFTLTTPLEMVTIGSVSRLAPVGMPAVVVDGTFIVADSVSVRGSAAVTLSTTFSGGWLFYTLDGADPAVSGVFYAGSFTVPRTCLLRTIAYNADFTQSVAGDPLTIVVLSTLTALTDGGGSVAIEPPAGDYFSNSMATVTASPAPGWTFLQWLGDATGTNPVVSVRVTRNKTVGAMFGTTLNTTVVGGGSIVVSPVSPWHPYGNQVRLTAVPATGNYLVFWANAASGETGNPLTFTVTNANPTVTAVFASLGGTETNALTVIPDGRGQVALTPPGNRYELNTNVVLQATPDSGQEFLGWGGDASGSENPLTVTMNSNKVITASFTKRPQLQGEGNPEMLSQDGFRLTLTGEFGAAYEIFGSTDLSQWTTLGTVTNTWGTVQFTDAAAATNSHRAYRAKAVE